MNKTQEQESNKQECLKIFIKLTHELLDNLSKVFPKCQKIKDSQEELGAVSLTEHGQTLLIEKWHQSMSPFYSACNSCDIDTLLNSNIGIIGKLDMRTKWFDPVFEDSRETLWEYIHELNLCSQEYHQNVVFEYFPKQTAQKIQDTVNKLTQQITQSGGGIESLGNLDIFKLGESLVGTMSPEEMEEFSNNLPKIMESMQSMMASENMPGMPDMAGMMSLVGTLNSPNGHPTTLGGIASMLGMPEIEQVQEEKTSTVKHIRHRRHHKKKHHHQKS